MAEKLEKRAMEKGAAKVSEEKTMARWQRNLISSEDGYI